MRPAQSVLDAMADAETLARAAALATWRRTAEEYAVHEARFHGEGAGYTMRYQGAAMVDLAALAAEQARNAARAAFRAVPELRGGSR